MSTVDEELEDAHVAHDLVTGLAVRGDAGSYVGQAPEWFGNRLFGGVLVAQAIHAATRTAGADRRIHSLHGYFLRPGVVGQPVTYDVAAVREGRSFALRRVTAHQEERLLFEGLCSFTADTDGYDYQLSAGAVPDPQQLQEEQSQEALATVPWDAVQAGPTAPEPDGTRRSTSRAWLRSKAVLPDDPHLHATVLGLFSDFTFTGGRPLHLGGGVKGLISLDHALWFHVPVRTDDWLLYDVHSLVNAGGRGVLRGAFYTMDRTLVASVAQEMLIRPVEAGA